MFFLASLIFYTKLATVLRFNEPNHWLDLHELCYPGATGGPTDITLVQTLVVSRSVVVIQCVLFNFSDS
jgi:hypothetical protein